MLSFFQLNMGVAVHQWAWQSAVCKLRSKFMTSAIHSEVFYTADVTRMGVAIQRWARLCIRLLVVNVAYMMETYLSQSDQ